MKSLLLMAFAATVYSFSVLAQPIEDKFDQFDEIYRVQLGSTMGCTHPQIGEFKVCSKSLKNEGNAPFILHHNQVTEKVVVLFHGLSDSPFFFRSIASSLYKQGYNVVVALSPGHGKKQADEDMEDNLLSDRWREHVAEIVSFSSQLGEKLYIGGFSTGGVLAAEYTIKHPKSVQGLLLFSGALALDESVESMSKIWGIQWLARLLDGEYQTTGRNPYKYPSVSRASAFELVEVIFSVRELLEQGEGLNLPIFSAHSLADKTTPIVGINDLMQANQGLNTLFEIAEETDVCHADIVISDTQLVDMQFDSSNIEEANPCDVPRANPKHGEMLGAMLKFMIAH